ncbi:MAG: cytochrome c oxidase subunit II [Chthoniobacter sp.]|uniref:cytochrome c oxidase subunit II n=1 Tax=Chthoniobacter sp. TaxID=2510640 RepID=UPI0032A3014B
MEHSVAFPFLPIGTVLRVFAPDSPQAHSIFNLGIVVTIILGTIFVLVGGAIVYALMRFRWREGEPDPDQLAGNKTVEIIWTLIPCAIVLALFLLTARTMGRSDPAPAPEPDLVVTGHQWWWEARYPKSGAVVANEIHIPVGNAFSVRLDSADVLHEFWVPELARKITAVPGHPNHLWIEADKPGTYLGVCSEFCGTEHAWMHFLVIAQSQAEFDAWQKAQLAPAATPVGDSAAKGLALFQQTSCVNCHAINGTSANAGVGPDLTHFASRRQLGAGIAENTRANLHRWLKDPQQVKPGVKMPDFKFTDEQVTQLVDYFETLK